MNVDGKSTLVASLVLTLIITSGISYLGFILPLRNENTEYQKININQANQIDTLTTTNSKLTTQIQQKTQEIESLQQQKEDTTTTDSTQTISELNQTYKQLQQKYAEINEQFTYMNDTYTYCKTLLESKKILVSINKIMVEIPDDYIFYFSGLQEETPTPDSGILIGSKEYSTSTFSFSWHNSTNTPNYNKTLDEMYNLISTRVTEQGERKNAAINEYQVVYEIHRMTSNNENVYIGYAVWYEPKNNYSYIYAMQEPTRILEQELLELVHTYRYNFTE